MSSNAEPYRIFPPATPKQRADLRASIDAVGLNVPLILDEHRNVIDGHDRREICEEIGIDWYETAVVRSGLSDIQKQALAIELNMWRKTNLLTQQQRNELITIYLTAHPEFADETIARMFGVDRSTVNRRRKQLVQTHKLKNVEATIGKDGVRRRVGQRGAQLTVKNKKEYDRLMPDIREVGDEIKGLIRRPGRVASMARRKRALQRVTPVEHLPESLRIECTDFRDFQIEDATVDLVLTDVVWSINSRQDWHDLGRQAAKWLKPDGLFVSYIGPQVLPHFSLEIMKSLKYQWTISMVFNEARLAWSSNMLEQWRPIVVFGKTSDRTITIADVIKCPPEGKEYDDWQQSLPVAINLMERLSKPGAVVVDPQLGTGTNAVAAALIGNRTFIGGDINPEKIKIARHRVATEGRNSTDKTPKVGVDLIAEGLGPIEERIASSMLDGPIQNRY